LVHVLHVVSDRNRNDIPLEEALIAAALGGADVLQIREKKAPAMKVRETCERVQKACTELGISPLLMVNDRVDVAMSIPTAGVHLAAQSLPLHTVLTMRRQFHWNGLVGLSVHSVEEAQAAALLGADYVTYGHIFASESHTGQTPRGLHALERLVAAIDIPVIAIGGIDARQVGPVLETGCAGIAVIGAIIGQPDVTAATLWLKEQMARVTTTPKVPFPTLVCRCGGDYR